MASLRTVLAGIFLMFSLASAYTPKEVPECKETLASGGGDYLSHEAYCPNFYRCVAGVKSNYTCGGNLLWDDEIKACNYPQSAKCANWPCTAANNNTNYPDNCGDRYYTCTGNGFMKNTCPTGQRFDMPTGTCVAGTPTDGPGCSRPVRNDSATCYLQPDAFGDVCKYQVVDGNRTHSMSCPDKMAFNQTSCGCTISNDACPKPTSQVQNKLPDTKCRQSMVLNMDLFFPDTGALRAFSEKINAPLNDSFQITGVNFNNGMASLSSGGNTNAQIYWFYPNNNEMTKYTGFVISFRFTAPTTNPVILLTNNFMEACIATLNVTATLSGNTYTVTAFVTFMTRNSMSNITYTSDTVTSSVTVSAANSFIEVKVYHEMMLGLSLTDKGPAGTTTGQVVTRAGTVNLGTSSTLAYNQCGWTMGRGLNGDIDRIAVHEGCRNMTMLMNS